MYSLLLGWNLLLLDWFSPSTWLGSHLDNTFIFNFFFGRTVSLLLMLQKSSLKSPVELTPRSLGCRAWQMARENRTAFHLQVPRGETRRQNWNSPLGTQQPTRVGQMHVDENEHIEGLMKNHSESYENLRIWISGLREYFYAVRCSRCIKTPW